MADDQAEAQTEERQPIQSETEVTLHIYDVTTSSKVQQVNRILQAVGTGVFHGGVEVFGTEWSYGYADFGSGVFSSRPKECQLHTYRESVRLGCTLISPLGVKNIIGGLEWTWQGNQYDVLERNCLTFCDELCKLLGVRPVPAWVRNLSVAGATLQRKMSDLAASTQDAQVKAAITVQRIWRGHNERKRWFHLIGPFLDKAKQKAKAAKAAAARCAALAAVKAAEKAHAAKDKAAKVVQGMWRKKKKQPVAKEQTPDESPLVGATPSEQMVSSEEKFILCQAPEVCSLVIRHTSRSEGSYDEGPRVIVKPSDGRSLGNCYLACNREDCALM